jgi:pyruvate dehydrogenase E2 component (dihydrolipoamide acetyltransferase)
VAFNEVVHGEPATVGASDGRSAIGVRATPLARQITRLRGVDLATAQPAGSGGRVVRPDVELVAQAQSAVAHVPAAAGGTSEGIEVVEPTRLKQMVARGMSETKAAIPESHLQTEVAIDAAIALRVELWEPRGAVASSLSDPIVKAAGIAPRSHPRVTGSYRDGRFELRRRVKVGIAVAAEDALVLRVITDADTRSQGSIATEAPTDRAGSHRPDHPAELSGGTFAVSNLGMDGIMSVSPIMNPRQAAILGVGAKLKSLLEQPKRLAL